MKILNDIACNQHPFGSFLLTKVDKIAEMKLNGVD